MSDETKVKANRSGPKPERSSGLFSTWGATLGVFVLALLPRVISLGAIITPDERRWVERSVNFFTALVQGNWAQTFQTGHPGVTTMWTGSLGLWVKYLIESPSTNLLDYLAQVPVRPSPPPDYLVATRLPTAVLTAIAIALSYLLVRRLFGAMPALLAAGLLALDPFYLAHSRVIHHDALVTTFILLGLLTFLLYIWRDRNKVWLVLSAASTALACLSKGSALFMLPFVGLMALIGLWTDFHVRPTPPRDSVRHWITVLLLWSAVMAVVFVVAWPAMWVDPVGTVGGMVGKAVQYAQEAHSKGNFFLGAPVEDPGPLFYPVVLLFRTTPLTLIGLLLCAAQLVQHARLRRHRLQNLLDQPGVMALVTLLAFVVLFVTFMSLGSKKFDRYLLPIFPIIDILAGVALAQVLRRIASIKPPAAVLGAIPIAVLCLQGLASLPQHPYYFSAYNALVGGPWLAQKALLVGWGEGLEQAAAYLNEKPDVQDLRAATFYYRDIETFFEGKSPKLVDDKPGEPAPWLESDYVVFYINQVQRMMPDADTVRYFQTLTPEFTFAHNGIPYVQVYRTPTDVPPALRIQPEGGTSPDQEQ